MNDFISHIIQFFTSSYFLIFLAFLFLNQRINSILNYIPPKNQLYLYDIGIFECENNSYDVAFKTQIGIQDMWGKVENFDNLDKAQAFLNTIISQRKIKYPKLETRKLLVTYSVSKEKV